MKLLQKLCLLFALFFAASNIASSQSFGLVKGRVADVNGGAIPKLVVNLIADDRLLKTTVTNENGQYILEADAGVYRIVFDARRTGFRTTIFENVKVKMDSKKTVNVKLDVDMDSEGSNYSEIVCVKDGDCFIRDRAGKGTTKPKIIRFKN